MRVDIIGKGAFQSVRVALENGEGFTSEAGKMTRMSAGIATDVTTRSRGGGGIMAGLKRLIGGDSFFLSTYRAARGPGEVILAPTHLGECRAIELDGSTAWTTTGGSYIASGPDIGTEPRWQGMKGFVSGESLVFLEATGRGPLIVGAFGALTELTVDGSIIVDTGHVVAFENTLEYAITKAGSSWFQSFLTGEGFVMEFKGHGRLLVQSHNAKEFGRRVGPQLPPREA